MSDDLFAGPYDLMLSAKEHIEEVITTLSGILNDDWAQIIRERDPETGDTLCKVAFSAPIPIRVGTRIFNVAAEMRAALDQAIYAATVALTEHADPASTKFPFGDTLAEAEGNLRRSGRNVPQPIADVLMAQKPYEAGNRTLWRLNKLRNVGDHRKLVVPAPSAKMVHASTTGFGAPKIEFATTASPDNGYQVARAPAGTNGQLNLGLVLHVAFGEVAAVKGLDPAGFLIEAHTAVADALDAIEKATIRVLKSRS